MNFCIILPAQDENLVLLTALIRCIKKQHPANRITCLGREDQFFVLQHHPGIHEQVSLNDPEAIRTARENDTYLVDLRNDVQSKSFLRNHQLKAHIFKYSPVARAVYQSLGINLLPKRHLAELYFESIKAFGVQYDGSGLDYSVPSSEEINETDLPASHHLGYIVMVLTGKPSEKFSARQIQEFCRMMDHPVVLMGGRKEFEWGEAIASFDPVKVYNACGKFSFHENADIIRRSKLVVSSHNIYLPLAAAFKKEIIYIANRVVPALGTLPFYPDYMLNKPRKPYDIISPKGKNSVKRVRELVHQRLAKPFKA